MALLLPAPRAQSQFSRPGTAVSRVCRLPHHTTNTATSHISNSLPIIWWGSMSLSIVWFGQTRGRQNGRPFWLLSFATALPGRPAMRKPSRRTLLYASYRTPPSCLPPAARRYG